MSNNRLRCPACRARQPWQATCRRCAADLRLYIGALEHVQRLQSQYDAAVRRGDARGAGNLLRELQRWDPQAAAAAAS